MNEKEKALLWLKAHGDSVERECADQVCALIPEYAILWARYIGNTGPAEHYPLEGLEKMSAEARNEVEKNFDGLCAAHYTLFNHVHSCQRKLRQADNEESHPRSGLTHFGFMEAMEEYYFHFGVIITQWERLWACVLGIDPDDRYLRSKVKQPFTQLFGAEPTEAKIYQQVLDTVVDAVRHTVEHYPRSAVFWEPTIKKFFIRYPRIKGEPWQETRDRQGADILAIKMMSQDLGLLTHLICSTYPKLIESVGSYLKKHGLRALASDAFENGDTYPVDGKPSSSPDISVSQPSDCSRPLNTATAVYHPKKP